MCMKIKRFVLFFVLISLLTCFSVNNIAFAHFDNKLYLGGYPAGFSIVSRGAFVNGICEVVTENGLKSPAKESGLRTGDIIYAINENEVNTANDIEKIIINGDNYLFSVLRDNAIISINLKPALDLNGKYRVGILIRDKINGIGTITYFSKNKIGSLGHAVLNENNHLFKIVDGTMYESDITGVVKGQKGKPGELKGVFKKNEIIAKINDNKSTGIYSTPNNIDLSKYNEIEVGEGSMGDAYIYTTVLGDSPKRYSISIIKIDENNKDNKNFVIKITDNELLNITGGIVQGMSGSPIVQDGKLIGAVTHVFINDPTRGFGIKIDKMLNS